MLLLNNALKKYKNLDVMGDLDDEDESQSCHRFGFPESFLD